jgi:predicted RecA/RadA family phage recombinase
MAKNYVLSGDVLDWTNNSGGAKTSGSVVAIGNTLGVCLVDIAASAVGAVQLSGVFSVPKVSAAVIAVGETLTWDASAGGFDDNLATPATGDITGASAIAWESAVGGVTTMLVKFTGAAGTRTA